MQGISFNGSFYAIGETIRIDVVTLKTLSDDEFTRLLEAVKSVNAEIVQAKAEQERQEREAREEFQRRQEEFHQQQAEFRRQQAEVKKQRTDLRVQILQNAGFVMRSDFQSLVFTTPDAGHIFIQISSFEALEGDAWDKKFFEIRAEMTRLRTLQAEADEIKLREQKEAEQRQAEELKRREAEANRREELANMMAARTLDLVKISGYKLIDAVGAFTMEFNTGEANPVKFSIQKSEIEGMDGESWGKFCLGWRSNFEMFTDQENKYREALATKAEQERQAALGDAEKIEHFLMQLAGIKRPELTDKKTSAAFSLFDQSVAAAIDTLHATLDKIK
jgi:hypothetical protein